ncbi:MAG: NADH-quinone oxidoreductase subunit J family protein, partial [Planctomycetia bacterium]
QRGGALGYDSNFFRPAPVLATLGLLLFALFVGVLTGGPAIEALAGSATPTAGVKAVGRSLYTDYLFAVELAGTLLLVATIGAIAITRREPGLVKP